MKSFSLFKLVAQNFQTRSFCLSRSLSLSFSLWFAYSPNHSNQSSLIRCVADRKFQFAFVTLCECRHKMRGERSAQIHAYTRIHPCQCYPDCSRIHVSFLYAFQHSHWWNEIIQKILGGNGRKFNESSSIIYKWMMMLMHAHSQHFHFMYCTYSIELLESRFPFAPVRPSSSPSSWFFVLSEIELGVCVCVWFAMTS